MCFRRATFQGEEGDGLVAWGSDEDGRRVEGNLEDVRWTQLEVQLEIGLAQQEELVIRLIEVARRQLQERA